MALIQGKSWREVGAAAAGGALAGAMMGSVIDTGGASLGVMVAAGALSGAAGGILEDTIAGNEVTAGSVALDAGNGAAGAMLGATVAKVATTATQAPRGATQLSKQAQKSIRSLEKNISQHQKKLEAYRRNPEAFDNKGFLKNAPNQEVRNQIIQGRIQHLENEISNYQNQIIRLTQGGG